MSKATASSSGFALGADISPTHAGLVLLNMAAEICHVWFVTSTVKDAAKDGGTRLPPEYATAKTDKRIEDPGARAALRLLWMWRWFEMVMGELGMWCVDGAFLAVALEDYAMGMEQGSHMIGETGGVFKLCALNRPYVSLRLHEPITLKMFVTGRGDKRAKDVMGDAVKAKWKVDFSKYGKAADDLVDAYSLARMALLEAQVRNGQVALKDCDEAALRVFNRTTDAYPENCLSRN